MTLLRLGTLTFVLALAACNGKQEHAEHPETEEGPMEEAGEDVDEAAEDVEEGSEEAVEETGDAFGEAGDEIEEETDEVE